MSKFVLEVLRAVRDVAVGWNQALPPPAKTPPYPTSSAAGGQRHDQEQLPPVPGGGGGAASPEGFVESTAVLACPPKPPPSPEREGLVEGFLEWGVRYALDNLARAQDNEVFPLVVNLLQV